MSSASGAVIRVSFGLVGLLLVVRFFSNGWIDSLLIDPPYHFAYPGFEWVRPWPAPWMQIHFLVIGLASVAVALGYRYRISAVVFTISLAHVELIDRTLYLNHYYWLVLTGALIVFLPLHSSHSLDARRGRAPLPGWYPTWVTWLLRFQVGMVYFFAGLAKLNGDWLFRAEPLATWLPARSELWLIGPILTMPATAYLLSWAGAFFDLTIVAWLAWPRTQAVAYVVLVGFHVVTWVLFPSIGVFPLLMSVNALVFFDPSWPDRLLRRSKVNAPPARPGVRPGRVAIGAAYLVLMMAIPLRHYLIPGDVKWTGEGYLGSWQVMLSEKSASADFLVTNPASGNTWRVGAPSYLTERQIMIMATDPVMIRQTAQLISHELGGADVAADVRLSFNGRPSTQFTNPDVVVSRRPVTEEIDDFVLAQPPA